MGTVKVSSSRVLELTAGCKGLSTVPSRRQVFRWWQLPAIIWSLTLQHSIEVSCLKCSEKHYSELPEYMVCLLLLLEQHQPSPHQISMEHISNFNLCDSRVSWQCWVLEGYQWQFLVNEGAKQIRASNSFTGMVVGVTVFLFVAYSLPFLPITPSDPCKSYLCDPCKSYLLRRAGQRHWAHLLAFLLLCSYAVQSRSLVRGCSYFPFWCLLKWAGIPTSQAGSQLKVLWTQVRKTK